MRGTSWASSDSTGPEGPLLSQNEIPPARTSFQHSPANMGFFSLFVMETGWTGWNEAIFRNLIPADIGNLIGGPLLVALPFWYAFQRMPNDQRYTDT